MIKYLLKFVAEKNHAEVLLNGTLFMRPASYYWHLEQGQGDINETAIIPFARIYKHSRLPIYCMYSVMDTDIVDNTITVSGRCIKDFKCEDGYVVIIDYPQFAKRLKTLKSWGFEVQGKLVYYHVLTNADTTMLLNDNTPRNVFIKHPYFAYQKEYRITVCHEIYKLGQLKLDHKEYEFSTNIRDIAYVQKVPRPKADGKYILSL